MESKKEVKDAKLRSKPISFRMYEDDLASLEREAGRRGVAASELARSIILARQETADSYRQADEERVGLRARVAQLEGSLASLVEERRSLLGAKAALNESLSTTRTELAEAVKHRDHLQEEARLAQARFRAMLDRVTKNALKLLALAGIVLGIVFVTGFILAFGEIVLKEIISAGHFAAKFPGRSIFTVGLILLAGLLTLFWGLDDEPFPVNATLVVWFIVVMIMLGVWGSVGVTNEWP